MEAPLPSRREKALVFLLLLTLVLPLLLTVGVHFTPAGPGLVGSLRQLLLGQASGEVSALPLPTFAELKSAGYQEGLARRFNEGFTGRDWVFRCTQEAYLHLFNSVQGPVVLGRHHNAYFNDTPFDFVNEYSVERLPADSLRDIVDGLRLWSENCRRRRVGFAVVITPSKASVYPEDLPAAWRRRFDPRPRAYDNFVRLLTQARVPYIDGHRLALEAKAQAPAPVFPLGGTHWDQYASLQTANAVLRALGSVGQPLRPIEHLHLWVDDNPFDEDADVATLIDPLVRWKYPVTRITYPPVPLEEGRRPSLAIIGGSFVGAMGIHLYRSEQFSEIHWLRYYREAKEIPNFHSFYGWQVLAKPFDDLNVEKEVYPAENLVLEINEQQLLNPQDLREFFADTLYRLPGLGTPKDGFPYATYLSCRWNEPVGFSLGALPGQPDIFSGLSRPEPAGSWSDGPDTTMRLAVPDLDQDVILSVVAGAAPIPGKKPLQRVSVFANGQPVAEWVHDDATPQQDEAVIPRTLLADGRLVLRFHYSNPTAPSEYSASRDTRRLALLFGKLTLRQAFHRVDGPVLSANGTGPGNSVYAVNFSGPEPVSRWTTGPTATLRLPVPPGEGDITLSAVVGALIDPAKLPVQHTSILVEGQSLGEWDFLASGTSRREVVIPRWLLTGDKLEVEFRFSRTIAPADLGASQDDRRLALLFQSVQLHWLLPAAGSSAPDKLAHPYQTFLPCRWNEPINFSVGKLSARPGVFSGLSSPDPAGSWSDGPDTTMRLTVPGSDQDVDLSVFAGSALILDKQAVQRVSVFANDQPVAEWVYEPGTSRTNKAVIPHAALADGKLILRFHYSNPTAPSEYSASPDTRKLALLFASMTLSPHSDLPVAPAPDEAKGP